MASPRHDWLRRASDDDLAVWAEIARGVRPLPGRKHAGAPRSSADAGEADSKKAAAQPPARPPRRPAPRAEPSLSERGLTGLDARQAERLRKGAIEVEARLDLHGLTQEAAHRALEIFLSASVAAGRRCVLVITGKGTVRTSPEASTGRFSMGERAGVLREMLPHWIDQSAHRPRIVALHAAHRKHGGAGAFYLYLRRKR